MMKVEILASFIGTGNVVELALLIRLDIGAVLLYAQGKLIAAGQANGETVV